MDNNISKSLINNIKIIADERHIPRDAVASALDLAIQTAFKKEFPETEIEIKIDIDNSILEVNRLLKVVEPYEDMDDYTEISIEDAKKHKPYVVVSEIYHEPINLSKLDRAMVIHILQVFKHNISTQSNAEIYKEWQPRIGEVIFAEVEKNDIRGGFVTVNLKDTMGFLSRQEQIPGEHLMPGESYNFYVKDVKEQTKGWPVILSRADVGLVKYTLRLQIPEIQENIIEIKDAARIAGFKTKISVISHQPGIEAVGTVIGNRGMRIKNVQEQLNGEHIEVFEYEDNFPNYLVNVCSPAELIGYKVEEPAEGKYIERREITLITRPDKLALLIGKKGANVRLISDLLKADIEIRTVDEAANENIKYEKIEINNSKQQSFKKTFNKYSSNTDILNKFNTSKITDLSSILTEDAKQEKKRKAPVHEEDFSHNENFSGGEFEE